MDKIFEFCIDERRAVIRDKHYGVKVAKSVRSLDLVVPEEGECCVGKTSIRFENASTTITNIYPRKGVQ